VVHLSRVVDLRRTREIVRSRVALIGNGNTLLFLTNSLGEVRKAFEIRMQQAAESGGYILSSRCDLPIETPFEAVQAHVEAAKG